MIMAAILIYVINLRSFGWTIQLVVEPSIFLEALTVGLLAAVVAGIYPGWRLQKMSVAEALKAE